MDLKALRAFVKVAEAGNISHAATALGLTQSSLSRIIAGLEKDVGGRLFYRTGRGVQLSEFGKAAFSRARGIIVNTDQLTADLRDFNQTPSGLVTLAVLPRLIRDIAGDLFEEVRRDYPAIRLRLLEGFSGHIDEWLADGRADIGLLSRYRRADAVDEEVMVASHLVVVGMPGVARRKTIRFRELAKMPVVLPASPNGLRLAVNDVARALRVRLHVIAEADSLEAQRAIIHRQECFAVLGRDTVAKEVERGTLQARTIVDPQLPRLLVMSTTTQRPLSRAARVVAAIVRRLVVAHQGAD